MKKGVAIGGLILVTVIWGGGFVASDMALESMKPFQIMMVRFLLASVLMGLVSMGQRKKEAKIENRAGAIKAGMLMGLTLFAGFALQIVGLQYTTPSKKCISYRIERRYRTVYCICDSEKEGWCKRNYRGDYGSSRSRTAFLERKSDTWYRRSAVTFLRCWICISDFPDRRICKKISGSRFESRSDVYRICAFHDQHVCIRRDRFSGYDQGMAQRLISRCDQYDHLLSASDRLSEVRGRNKSSHHTLYGVRIWNGVFHYHSA